MKTVVAALVLFFSLHSEAIKRIEPKKYRVLFEVDHANPVDQKEKFGNIIITGPRLWDSGLRLPKSYISSKIKIPFKGFADEKFNHLETFLDPHVAAVMFEQALNARKITIKDTIEFLDRPNWHTSFYSHPLSDKLTAPSTYRVHFQTDSHFGNTSHLKTGLLTITGPGILDYVTHRPSSTFSALIAIQTENFEMQHRPEGFVEPYLIAQILEDGLNEKKLSLHEVYQFVATPSWNTLFQKKFASNDLSLPVDYRVMFQVNTAPGNPLDSHRGNIAVVGKTSMTFSSPIQIERLAQDRLQFMDSFIDPYALAAILEDGLNEARVQEKEVANFLKQENWHTSFQVRNDLRRAIETPGPSRPHKCIDL